MAENSGKPPPKPPGKRPADQHEPGRLGIDDLGNVQWEWSADENLQADDTLGAAQRLSALVDPALDVVDDENPNAIQHNPKGLVKGYNPYDSGALGKQTWKKKKDLRELSKWIELKRKTERKKDGG
jgi:hypothetical protein